MKLREFLEKQGKAFWGIIGFLMVILLGVIDYATGVELSLSLFYIIPISITTWYAGRRIGMVLAASSAVTWFLADLAGGLYYSHPTIYIWNTLIRLGSFIAISYLLSLIRKEYNTNQQLARVDHVTGAVSVHHFYELAKLEILRFQRYKRPFTFAYIDLDSFKLVNDRLGHSTGDRLLQAVVDSIRRQIRPNDILARLGGDEFGLLLYETDNGDARSAISRIHLGLVADMLKNGWSTTFSIGVVTFQRAPRSVDEMVKIADKAMYSVKNSTKNGVTYETYTG